MSGSWSERAKQVLPLFGLFLLGLIFFSDILRSGGLFTERDLASFFIPPRHFWVACLKSGEFPLWNPLNFGGHPFFATLQPGVIYPPDILYFLLPFDTAFDWIIIGHFFLAGSFTYAFLRFFDAGRGASFLGASIFQFGGYLLSLHSLLSALLSLAWLPLILLLFARAIRLNSLGTAAWAGVVLAISFFGGGVETIFGTCVALGIMAAFARSFGGDVMFSLKALLVAGLVFAGLSSIQMIPFLELASQSVRQSGLNYHEATTWSASPIDFISFLVPDPYGSLTDIKKYWVRQSWLKTLYVGGIPFFLAAIYLSKGRKVNYFWLVLAAFSLFLALGGYNPLYPYLHKYVPQVNKIRYPVKFLFLGMFALCMMAGLGLQHLLDSVRGDKAKLFRWSAIILATAAAFFLLWLNVQHDKVLAFLKAAGLDKPGYNDATVNLHNFKRMLFYLVVGSALLWLIIETRGARYAISLLCIVLILDLFGNIGYYASLDPHGYWADNWTTKQVKAGLGEYRVFTTPLTSAPASTILAPNIATPLLLQRILTPSLNLNYGIRSMWGAEVMRVSRTDDLYRALTDSPSVDSTRIVDLFSVKYIISTKPISSPYFTLAGADIEGLKGGRKKLLKEPTIKLYRNRRVPPRAFLIPNYRVITDPAEVLKEISQRDFDPLRIAVLEEQPVWDRRILTDENFKDAASVSIVRESNNNIELAAKVSQPSLLYLADTFFPGWNVYVDGIKTKIYRANYNFRAMPLPTGAHHVVFRYEPLSFYAGVVLSGITLLILLALGLRALFLRSHPPKMGEAF